MANYTYSTSTPIFALKCVSFTSKRKHLLCTKAYFEIMRHLQKKVLVRNKLIKEPHFQGHLITILLQLQPSHHLREIQY